MRLGIWAPAPQTIRADPTVKPAFEALTRSGGGVDASFAYAVDVLQRSEELGFEITLIAQRFLGPDLDSWILASALATQTKSIELMAAVHPGIMDPRIAAKLGATIDRISGGRFCVNVVNGSRPQEFEVFGEWIEGEAGRYRRMHEFIKMLKGMWTEDDFSFQGEFYKVEHGAVPTKCVRSPHPPIYAASRVEEGMNVIAQDCDTWFVNYDKDHTKHNESLRRIEREIGMMERRLRELNRSMRYGINAIVFIADSDAEARAKVEEHLAQARTDPTMRVGASGVGAALFGTPRTIMERIRRYESLGIDLLMLHFYPMKDGLEDFAQKIIPDIRRAEVPAFAEAGHGSRA